MLTEISVKDWNEEGERLFGVNRKDWKFVCPNCGNIQCGHDFIELNEKGISKVEPENTVFFSCIGRFDTRVPEDKVGTIFDKEPKRKPCNYTNGGLFCFAKVIVKDETGRSVPVFDFFRGEKQ